MRTQELGTRVTASPATTRQRAFRLLSSWSHLTEPEAIGDSHDGGLIGVDTAPQRASRNTAGSICDSDNRFAAAARRRRLDTMII